MPKQQAALIITDDVGMLFCDNGDTVVAIVTPTEQLLADLQLLVKTAEIGAHSVKFVNDPRVDGFREAIARVRALLPEEGEDD